MRFALLALPAAGCFGPLFGPGALAPEQELLTNVEQIRTAQVELLAVDDFVACGSEAEARASVSSSPRAWDGPACWARIGWAPDGPIRGGYWVEVSADGQDFTAHGLAPGDLRAVATRAEPARLTEDPR